jgi:hypothetical protein
LQAFVAQRRRIPVQLSPYSGEPARVGHNRGPELDLSWEAWLWRRAHAQAWKAPRRDIALHRLKRAERLGLDYRSYAGVLMNRGTHLGAAIFVFEGFSDGAMKAAARKVVEISDCRVLIGVDAANDIENSLRQRADKIVECGSSRTLAHAIDRFLLAHQLTPGGAFMVGTSSAHLRIAEDCGLALFLWAKDYFAAATH